MTSAPSAPTSRTSPPTRRRPWRRTSPWRAPPPTAPCSTVGCCRSGPRPSGGSSTRRWPRRPRPRPGRRCRDRRTAPRAHPRGAGRARAGPRRRPPVGAGADHGRAARGPRRADAAARASRWSDGPSSSRSSSTRCSSAPGEDLDRYPRTFDADLAVCAREGVDVVFAPSVDEVYPGGEPQVTVDPGPLAHGARGRHPPGPLPRRADRGRQALRPGPPRRGRLRREGLPAADADPADGRATCACRSRRRRADRARGRRPGPLQPQPLPRRGAAPGGRGPPRTLLAGPGGGASTAPTRPSTPPGAELRRTPAAWTWTTSS